MPGLFTMRTRPPDSEWELLMGGDTLELCLYDIPLRVPENGRDFGVFAKRWAVEVVFAWRQLMAVPGQETVLVGRLFPDLTRDEWTALVGVAENWTGSWRELIDAAQLLVAEEA